MRRDLLVLRKDIVIFCLRTVIQPFLLVFVFLYVFPTIGQGVGSSGHGHAAAVAESAFATVLVPGVVAISIMFQGLQAVALPMAQEFGFTREIEDRVQAPCPIWIVAVAGSWPRPRRASSPPSWSSRSRPWCTPRASRRT